MEKITKRNIYTALINFANGNDMAFETEDGFVTVDADALRAFAENEIGLLDKKAAKAKESAAKRKNETNPLRDAALAQLGDEFEPIAEIAARIDGEDVTVAKVTYQLNKLVELGLAEKQLIKVASAEGKKARQVQGYKAAEVAESDAE